MRGGGKLGVGARRAGGGRQQNDADDEEDDAQRTQAQHGREILDTAPSCIDFASAAGRRRVRLRRRGGNGCRPLDDRDFLEGGKRRRRGVAGIGGGGVKIVPARSSGARAPPWHGGRAIRVRRGR